MTSPMQSFYFPLHYLIDRLCTWSSASPCSYCQIDAHHFHECNGSKEKTHCTWNNSHIDMIFHIFLSFMPWTHDNDDKISRCIRWYYEFIASLLKVSMQITKYMFITVIKIFIFYMVSTTACVAINAYMNIPWFTFLKGPLA